MTAGTMNILLRIAEISNAQVIEQPKTSSFERVTWFTVGGFVALLLTALIGGV